MKLFDLIRGADRKADGYSRALQVARVRAAHQRSYFAPALFNLIPVETDLIDSMAVDSHWRLYYNRAWLAAHTVEENASLLIHEVSHLLRDHESRRNAERYYIELSSPARTGMNAAGNDPTDSQESSDCGSGAHGERRFWELPAEDVVEGGVPSVDHIKAQLVRREVARLIDEKSPFDNDVPLGWRRW